MATTGLFTILQSSVGEHSSCMFVATRLICDCKCFSQRWEESVIWDTCTRPGNPQMNAAQTAAPPCLATAPLCAVDLSSTSEVPCTSTPPPPPTIGWTQHYAQL
mmetsp:Transcript_139517/g.242721  ORF Transcript_139517/g.242721 Transcript_139517/m.242721 type:complete len:104 (+) Transcript_139517:1002-1313(+)